MITLLLATALELPDPEHPHSIGFIIGGICALVVLLKVLLDFHRDYMKEKPTPALTYVTLSDFRAHKEERREDVDEIKTKLDELSKAITDSNKYHAKARSEMHRRQNNLENALYYMAGKMENEGDSHAARIIRERLEKSTQSTTHED